MKKAKVVFFKGRNKNYYFRVVAKNGEIICQSEGYKTRNGRTKGLKSLMAALSNPLTTITETDSHDQKQNNKLINQL